MIRNIRILTEVYYQISSPGRLDHQQPMQHRNISTSKALQRAHSFINRTPYTVLNISNKSSWAHVVGDVIATAFDQNCRNGKKVFSISQAGLSVRCVKIEDCSISVQQVEQHKQQTTDIVSILFPNLQKLTISKCKSTTTLQFLNTLPLYFQPCHKFANCLQNLQQLYIPYNNLKQFPLLLLSSHCCPVLLKLDISHNYIRTIDFQLQAISRQINYVDLRSNCVEYIGGKFWASLSKSEVQVQFQWSWQVIGLLFGHVNQDEHIGRVEKQKQKVISNGTDSYTSRNTTEADHHTQEDEHANLINTISDDHSSPTPTTIICLPQQIAAVPSIDKYHKILVSQLELLVNAQHIHYLKYMEQLISHQMTESYIQACFRNKKYRSLEYFMVLYQKYQGKFNQSGLGRVLAERNANVDQKLEVTDKPVKSNKQNRVAGRKQIRMLQPKNKQNKLTTHSDGLIAADPYILHKLISLNLSIISQISDQRLQQISVDQLIWLLNQLQLATLQFGKQKVQALFKCAKFGYLVNSIVNGEREFFSIVNTVSHRQAIKDLILWVDFRFMGCSYDFQSHAILRVILSFDDLQIYQKYKQKHPKFVPALLNPYPFSLTSSSALFPSPLFKTLLSPTHKLYKHLCSAQRRAVRIALASGTTLNTHSYHNWHFPEYAPEQSIVIHNDVHDYEVLKQYQQFQASFMYKDFKLHVRSNRSNGKGQYSVAQKIINQVKDHANRRVRNIGKTHKQIDSTNQNNRANLSLTSSANEYGNTSLRVNECLDQSNFMNRLKTTDNFQLIKSNNSNSFSYLEVQKPALTHCGQQHENTTKSPSRLRSSRGSIEVLSKLNSTHSKKSRRNKLKNGIFLFSSPQHKNAVAMTTLSHPCNKIQYKYGAINRNKVLYLDLSKNSNDKHQKHGHIIKDEHENTGYGSSIQKDIVDLSNWNRPKVNGDGIVEGRGAQIQCSTFDPGSMINCGNHFV